MRPAVHRLCRHRRKDRDCRPLRLHSALSDSWTRPMLIPVVKARYGDAPVFLDVSSVIESYELTQAASAGY